MFGAATKNLLYIGVRNRYCAVCSIAKKRHLTPQHKYLKNWSGSSTSMEADIIAAGVKALELMHGLHYTEMIDSSVLHTVQTTVPYGRHGTKYMRLKYRFESTCTLLKYFLNFPSVLVLILEYFAKYLYVLEYLSTCKYGKHCT